MNDPPTQALYLAIAAHLRTPYGIPLAAGLTRDHEAAARLRSAAARWELRAHRTEIDRARQSVTS